MSFDLNTRIKELEREVGFSDTTNVEYMVRKLLADVLSEILPKEKNITTYKEYAAMWNACIAEVKQAAKAMGLEVNNDI